MAEFVYVFTGKVMPERVAMTISPLTYVVSAGADMQPSSLHVEIQLSQIHARLVCPAPPLNLLTARNLVADVVRSILDVVGFVGGRGLDAEISQVVAADGSRNIVFDHSIPALQSLLAESGLNHDHIFSLMTGSEGWRIARALADFRDATRNPIDTGFFCYRAIETLMHFHAATTPGLTAKQDKFKWGAFREHYGVDRADVDLIKAFADPVRHGSGLSVIEITDANRADIFRRAWKVGIAVFLRAHADLSPAPA